MQCICKLACVRYRCTTVSKVLRIIPVACHNASCVDMKHASCVGCIQHMMRRSRLNLRWHGFVMTAARNLLRFQQILCRKQTRLPRMHSILTCEFEAPSNQDCVCFTELRVYYMLGIHIACKLAHQSRFSVLTRLSSCICRED